MFYELRRYEIRPETWGEFLDWGVTKAAPALVDQLGFRLVGRWEVLPKEGEHSPTFCWMLAWESEQEMNERWAEAVGSDAWKDAWASAVDPATGASKFHLSSQSNLMRPLALSPLQ
ncbi:MAG: NIPSNAP family protein [Thermomicrobiales bacterium]